MNLMKQRRIELKMTQIEAAIACGVSLAGYIMWEKGVGKPAKERRKKVIDVMGLPANYFDDEK